MAKPLSPFALCNACKGGQGRLVVGGGGGAKKAGRAEKGGGSGWQLNPFVSETATHDQGCATFRDCRKKRREG